MFFLPRPCIRLLQHLTPLVVKDLLISSLNLFMASLYPFVLVSTLSFSLNCFFAFLVFILPMLFIDSNHICHQPSFCQTKQGRLLQALLWWWALGWLWGLSSEHKALARAQHPWVLAQGASTARCAVLRAAHWGLPAAFVLAGQQGAGGQPSFLVCNKTTSREDLFYWCLAAFSCILCY